MRQGALESTSYTIPTGHRYTSQRWEDKLGLYDYNARYYDPTTARFLSADTLIPDPVIPVKTGTTLNPSSLYLYQTSRKVCFFVWRVIFVG